MVLLSPLPAPLGGSPCLGPCSDTPILATLSIFQCWIRIMGRSNVRSRAMLRLLYEKGQRCTGTNSKPLPRIIEAARWWAWTSVVRWKLGSDPTASDFQCSILTASVYRMNLCRADSGLLAFSGLSQSCPPVQRP
jgi:hypothetical protein